MRAKTLQIHWHAEQPVLSVDFSNDGVLATAGADKTVKLWALREDAGGRLSAAFLSELPRHTTAVNVVRFSPAGDRLVTGADGGDIFVWRPAPHEHAETLGGEDAVAGDPAHCWKPVKMERAVGSDVMDVAWSPDGTAVAAGSIENETVILDSSPGSHVLARYRDHRHFVQGVAWDPWGVMLATAGGDRTVRVYSLKQAAGGKKAAEKRTSAQRARNFALRHTLRSRASQAAAEGASGSAAPTNQAAADAPPRKLPMWQDDSSCAFFRRLSWSPDGAFLLAPSGLFQDGPDAPTRNACFLLPRGDAARPAVVLPGLGTPSVAARFCPKAFRLPDPAPASPMTGLPYKLVFAVASKDSVAIYDTAHTSPIAVVGALHLAEITDLAWSPCGRRLAVSSRDGFCSVVAFDKGELGEPLGEDDFPASIRHLFAPREAPAPSTPPACPPRTTPTATPSPARGAGSERPCAQADGEEGPGPAAAGSAAGESRRCIQPAPVGRKRVAPVAVKGGSGAAGDPSGGDETAGSVRAKRQRGAESGGDGADKGAEGASGSEADGGGIAAAAIAAAMQAARRG